MFSQGERKPLTDLLGSSRLPLQRARSLTLSPRPVTSRSRRESDAPPPGPAHRPRGHPAVLHRHPGASCRPCRRPSALPGQTGDGLVHGSPVRGRPRRGRHPGTRWSSAFADPQWIQVDLGGSARISEVALNWEAAYAKAFQVQVSADARTWSTVHETATGTVGNQRLTVSGTGRYVRVHVGGDWPGPPDASTPFPAKMLVDYVRVYR
ncbi:discoidin domain-containing protein [Streptomyces pharetrae]|uniref:discoidin domain-containing protein n=1 Tax=Streptomyces pharetrae TaxID=291370 RepID=UPI00334BCEEE